MSKPDDYEAYMRKFMSYGDNFEYEKGHIYPEDQLLLITRRIFVTIFTLRRTKVTVRKVCARLALPCSDHAILPQIIDNRRHIEELNLRWLRWLSEMQEMQSGTSWMH